MFLWYCDQNLLQTIGLLVKPGLSSQSWFSGGTGQLKFHHSRIHSSAADSFILIPQSDLYVNFPGCRPLPVITVIHAHMDAHASLN